MGCDVAVLAKDYDAHAHAPFDPTDYEGDTDPEQLFHTTFVGGSCPGRVVGCQLGCGDSSVTAGGHGEHISTCCPERIVSCQLNPAPHHLNLACGASSVRPALDGFTAEEAKVWNDSEAH